MKRRLNFELGEIYEQRFDPDSGRFIDFVATGKPYMLDLTKHYICHLRGRPRCGKTSMVLQPWAYEYAKCDGPLFIIDFAPEPANLEHARRAAKAAGKNFKVLCLEPGKESWHFPPFQFSATSTPETAVQIAQLVVVATNADHGGDKTYFTYQGASALYEGVNTFLTRKTEPTATDMAEYLRAPDTNRDFPHCAEMAMSIGLLSQYPQIGHGARNIIIDECVGNGDVCYFYLSNISAPLIGRLVAGFVIATILHVARERCNKGCPKAIRIHIDEVQAIVGRQLAALCSESLKYHCTYCWSHQFSHQLKTREADLRPMLFDGSDLKIYFSSTGEDIEAIQSLSKKTRIEKMRSTSGQGMNAAANFSEQHVPFISEEAILEASETFGMAIVASHDGAGHKEPAFVKLSHTLQHLNSLALPDQPRMTEQSAPLAAPPIAIPPGRRVPMDEPSRAARQKWVREQLEACLVEERWEGGDT